MKKIRIEIGSDTSAIDDLIRQIEELPQKLAEEGAKHVNFGLYTDVVTSAENGNIIARGEDVGFAEYGTGVLAEKDPEAPISTGFGTWSASEDGSKQLINKGYWYYNKQRYTGTPPTRAMRYAIEYLKQNGAKIAEDNIR